MKCKCKVTGCDKEVKARGFCSKHYRHILRHGEIRPEIERRNYSLYDVCLASNCDRRPKVNGYCQKHYRQLVNYGKLLQRTIHDRNEIVLLEDYAEIVLYNFRCEEIARTVIDVSDVEKIRSYKWSLSKGYVVSEACGYLHRFLLGNPPRMFDVDHINHNPLDNRKSNLRTCTRSQNNMNSPKRRGKGISWCKQKNKWHVRVYPTKGRAKHIGFYDNYGEALAARLEAERIYYGEYACRA